MPVTGRMYYKTARGAVVPISGIPTSAVQVIAADSIVGTDTLVTHNLNTRDVSVNVYATTSPWNAVITGVSLPSVNTVNIHFASPVAAGDYRIVVMGVQH